MIFMPSLEEKINSDTFFTSLFLFRLFLIVSVIPGLSVFGFSQPLPEQAKISVLTCGPGKPIYASFGHSAIRIQDPARSLDNVYNFGTFDFNTGNFYLKFLAGKLDYILSVDHFSNFYNEYKAGKRWIYEQELNMTPMQYNRLYDTLVYTAMPANRSYRYDFFNANCAT